MNPKKFQTVEACDQRFVWLDTQIEICIRRSLDKTEPKAKQFASRAVNLKHEKRLLESHRQHLLTPELI